MSQQYKCDECGATNETTLIEKDGKNPMSLTICSTCGSSQKVVQVGDKLYVKTMPDNP